LTEQPCALAVTCGRHDEEEEDESDAILEEDIYFGLHGNEACLCHHHEFFLFVKLSFFSVDM
jgi:hypothetical protein